MLLLTLLECHMFKRQTVASSGYGRWRRRRSSAVRTLVAETLVLAKTHGYVEKIEDELERELQRDFSDPPQEKILRCRRVGDKIFKSKHMLLIVVILCIVDCALVLGELALDLYKVKAKLESTEELSDETQQFLTHMVQRHPIVNSINMSDIFSMLLNSTIFWHTTSSNTSVLDTVAEYSQLIPCSVAQNFTQHRYGGYNVTNASGDLDLNLELLKVTGLVGTVAGPGQPRNNSPVINGARYFAHENAEVEIIGKIAHIFHYCSIAILSLIMIETLLKAICAGKSFFHRKIEVFDTFVVVMSFLMDFSFLVFLPDIDTKDFVFILAILLPWRVIRVVNSLVVSVKDHEHFRLKLVYKRKKKIQGTLRDTETMLQKYMTQVTALQRLCIVEGIEEWKMDNYLKNEELTFPPTPSKRKFKFKFDDALSQLQGGQSRSPRCSLPALDFHGLKLPSNAGHKSKLSLPSVANSIRQHISKKLPTRRASLATAGIYNVKQSNGDVRRKKAVSEDLGTMHEESGGSENEGSTVSSRGTSESGDTFRRMSITDSIASDRLPGYTPADGNDSDSNDDEFLKIARIQEDAKRRNSESILDTNKRKASLRGIAHIISYKTANGKTVTKPNKPKTSPIHESDNVSCDPSKCDADDIEGTHTDNTPKMAETEITFIDEENNERDLKRSMQNIANENTTVENNNENTTVENNNTLTNVIDDVNAVNSAQCNGDAHPTDINKTDVIPIVIIHSDSDV